MTRDYPKRPRLPIIGLIPFSHWDFGDSGGGFPGEGYNPRNELIRGKRRAGTTLGQENTLPPGDHEYDYDPIGNRTQYTLDSGTPTYYCANRVNQYHFTDDEAPAANCGDSSPPQGATESFTYDEDGNLTQEAKVRPYLLSAKSVRQHGTVGEFDITLPLTGSGGAGVECRSNGPTIIELEFTDPVAISCDNVSLSSGSCSAVTPQGGNAYRIAMSGATDIECLTVTLTGVEDGYGHALAGVKQIKVVVLKGDVNGDGTVNILDLVTLQNELNEPVDGDNFRCDVNADGAIDVLDLVAANSNLSLSAACPTLPDDDAMPPVRTFTWDAENRLTGVGPAVPCEGDKKLEFAYDYLGRRVEKRVYVYDGGWPDPEEPDERWLFVYDNWNVFEVLDGNSSNAVRTKYTWGLDLSGLAGAPGASAIHGAGGIGGLLAVEETATSGSPAYWFLYDGNGNVGQVIKASDQSTVARYEYDPYGNAIVATGSYAAANPFRFSTKWFDAETGLGYWGYRYYSPQMGRWLNRDPIGESAGPNLLAFLANDPMNKQDHLGLVMWDCAACAAAVAGKLGGGIAGCAWGCAEADRPPGYSYGDCLSDCVGQFFSRCELWKQFKNNKAEWVGAAACVSCGVRLIKDALAPDPPPDCDKDKCPEKKCPPCPAKTSRVDRSHTHWPCPGDHVHSWINTGQGPWPGCKCSYREKLECI